MKNCARRVVLFSLMAVIVICLVHDAAGGQGSSSESNAAAKQEQAVRDFITAFNERALDHMAAAIEDEFQWLSVNGAQIAIEAEGKAELRKSMKSYFASCPSCRSSLVWTKSAGNLVTALERATWAGKDGTMSQMSLSVYEFGETGIRRVYYFPAER